MSLDQMDVIELNEAFASQALAVTRDLGLADDDPRINPNGGAIALGHPLGMSGARLVTTALYELLRSGGRFALCAMCIGVGQGIAMIIERVKRHESEGPGRIDEMIPERLSVLHSWCIQNDWDAPTIVGGRGRGSGTRTVAAIST